MKSKNICKFERRVKTMCAKNKLPRLDMAKCAFSNRDCDMCERTFSGETCPCGKSKLIPFACYKIKKEKKEDFWIYIIHRPQNGCPECKQPLKMVRTGVKKGKIITVRHSNYYCEKCKQLFTFMCNVDENGKDIPPKYAEGMESYKIR